MTVERHAHHVTEKVDGRLNVVTAQVGARAPDNQ
jgi:hypothetical protein